MQATRKIKFIARKPYDYLRISNRERRRLTKLITRKIISIAYQFDGLSSFTVIISAKGNA